MADYGSMEKEIQKLRDKIAEISAKSQKYQDYLKAKQTLEMGEIKLMSKTYSGSGYNSPFLQERNYDTAGTEKSWLLTIKISRQWPIINFLFNSLLTPLLSISSLPWDTYNYRLNRFLFSVPRGWWMDFWSISCTHRASSRCLCWLFCQLSLL